MRHINEIIVHCSATLPDWMADKNSDQKVAEIDRWHKARGWKGFGYHAFIDRDGTIVDNDRLDRGDPYMGAHVSGNNDDTLGVCLAGGHGSAASDEFEDHFTASQDAALRHWIAKKKRQHPTIKKVNGHNKYAAKACPGFRVDRWLMRKPEPAPTPLRRPWWSRLFGGASTSRHGNEDR